MKKFFLLFAVAGALVACNNEAETTSTDDTLTSTTTEVTPTAPTIDTTNMSDTTMGGVDTTNRQ